MYDMEKDGHKAKKSSLMALHKLMKDLHHKSMQEPHKETSIEIHAEALPDHGEHDEENEHEGVDPFNASQMEGDEGMDVDGEHDEMAHDGMTPHGLDEDDGHMSDSDSEMKLPDGLHEMLKKHLAKKGK